MKSIENEIRKKKISESINEVNKHKEKKSETPQKVKKHQQKVLHKLEILQNKSGVRVKDQIIKCKPGDILIIMKSNRKFICFKELFTEDLSESNSSIIVCHVVILIKQGIYYNHSKLPILQNLYFI